MKLCDNIFSKNPVVVPEVEEVEYVPKRSDALMKAQRKYYEKNKEKITYKQTLYNKSYTKITKLCDCGDMVTNAAKYTHIKSARHLRRIENIKNGKLAGCTPGEEHVNCDCGGHFIYKHRYQHFKTKKHIVFELDQQKEIRLKLSQHDLRGQLRLMLLGEGLDTTDIDNVNNPKIKEI